MSTAFAIQSGMERLVEGVLSYGIVSLALGAGVSLTVFHPQTAETAGAGRWLRYAAPASTSARVSSGSARRSA